MKNYLMKIFKWFLKNVVVLFLLIFFVVSLLDFLSIFWEVVIFDREKNGLQNLLLFWAFGAAAYYAFVTHRMWQINKDPVLRIKWNDLGKDSYFQKLKKQHEDLYNTFTDLQLINDGNGSVRDIVITVKYLCLKKSLPELRNVTAMGPRGYTQLRYKGDSLSNRGRPFNNEFKSYQEPFVIMIDYIDIYRVNKKIIFEVDENYNDGFRIL